MKDDFKSCPKCGRKYNGSLRNIHSQLQTHVTIGDQKKSSSGVKTSKDSKVRYMKEAGYGAGLPGMLTSCMKL